MIFDTSDSRLTLLNMLYSQLLANHISNSVNPRFSPPPLRPPQTANPFGMRLPTGALTAPATHGQGWEIGGGATHLGLVGSSALGSGPSGAFGPIPQPQVGPGNPRFSPPAARPPAGLPGLPR